MKVSGTKSNGASKVGGSRPARTSGASVTNSPRVESASATISKHGADEVEVSDSAATIELIKDLVGSTPDIRLDQVERISKKLRDGSYKINYEKVAEAFIREVILTEISRKPRKK